MHKKRKNLPYQRKLLIELNSKWGTSKRNESIERNELM